MSLDLKELISLLSEQCEFCARLAELADSQRSLITGDQPERLLSVLAERQSILEKIEVLKGKLQPYQQNWSMVCQQMTESESRQVDRLVDEVNTLLSNILAKDKADAQLLAARKSSTCNMINDLKTGKQAGDAYAAVSSAGGSKVDWTDE